MSISISGNGGITGATSNYSFDQSVSIGGTLTYEDVTNIDSVGVITARSGIIVSSGSSIGIGITEPTCKLQLRGNKMTADRAMIRLSDDQSGNGNFFVSSAGSGSANKLTIGEADDTFVSITGDESGGNTARRGYIGVGTDNPINNLHVNNSTTGVGPVIQLTNDTGDCRLFFGQSTTVGDANAQGQLRYNVAGNYMAMYTSGSERVRIAPLGNVGIGSDIPRSKLDVNGTMMGNGSHEESLGGDVTIDKTITFNRRGAFMMLISFALGTTTTDFTRNIYSFGLFVPRSNGATWTQIQQDLISSHVGTFTISDNGSAGQLRVQKTAGSDGRQCSFRIDVLSSCDVDIVVANT